MPPNFLIKDYKKNSPFANKIAVVIILLLELNYTLLANWFYQFAKQTQ